MRVNAPTSASVGSGGPAARSGPAGGKVGRNGRPSQQAAGTAAPPAPTDTVQLSQDTGGRRAKGKANAGTAVQGTPGDASQKASASSTGAAGTAVQGKLAGLVLDVQSALHALAGQAPVDGAGAAASTSSNAPAQTARLNAGVAFLFGAFGAGNGGTLDLGTIRAGLNAFASAWNAAKNRAPTGLGNPPASPSGAGVHGTTGAATGTGATTGGAGTQTGAGATSGANGNGLGNANGGGNGLGLGTGNGLGNSNGNGNGNGLGLGNGVGDSNGHGNENGSGNGNGNGLGLGNGNGNDHGNGLGLGNGNGNGNGLGLGNGNGNGNGKELGNGHRVFGEAAAGAARAAQRARYEAFRLEADEAKSKPAGANGQAARAQQALRFDLSRAGEWGPEAGNPAAERTPIIYTAESRRRAAEAYEEHANGFGRFALVSNFVRALPVAPEPRPGERTAFGIGPRNTEDDGASPGPLRWDFRGER